MTASEFYFDCEEDVSSLQNALRGVAECDVPFLIEILLVDEAEIQKLNREQRGVDKVTDVLSFPSMELSVGAPIHSDEHAEELDEENRLFLGSVVICKQRAAEQAEEYGHPLERELGYLTVHGVLHCLGYDHIEEEDKKTMRAKEEEIMARMGLIR